MWKITWYEKTDDWPLGELILRNINSLELKRVFSISEDEEMVYIYPINENHEKFFQEKIDQEKIDHKINLEQYDYHLEMSRNQSSMIYES